jgi:hypothetical protein
MSMYIKQDLRYVDLSKIIGIPEWMNLLHKLTIDVTRSPPEKQRR